MLDDGVIAQELRARLAMRCAAGDLLQNARGFLRSAVALAEAAHAWDPDGTREDPMVLGVAEAAGDLLTLAARSSPGIRLLFIEAVEASAPAEASAPGGAPPPAAATAEAVPATSTTAEPPTAAFRTEG